MASAKKDKGLIAALAYGAKSRNQSVRSAVSGFGLYEDIGGSSDYKVWTEGDIPVGFINDGSAPKGTVLHLDISWLTRNTLIAGRAGSGKSHLCKVLLSGLMKNIRVMVFDRLSDYNESFVSTDTLRINCEDIRLNPIMPPKGVPFAKWIEYLSSTFIHAMFLTDVARGSLIQLINQATSKYSNSRKIPSIYELKLAIGDFKRRYMKEYSRLNYWSRLEDRIDNVINGPLGKIFAAYTDHDLEDLLSRNVIFDVSGLSSHSVRILVSIIMIKIFCYRLFNNHGGRSLHAVVLEEAEDIFGEKAKGIIENPMDDMARRIRGRGECLIIINQSYKTLSPALRANTFTHIMLGMSRPDERYELGRAMGLSDMQWEDANRLDRPNAFVSIEGEKPVLIRIPEYRTAKNKIFEKQIMDGPDYFPYIPVPESIIREALNNTPRQEKLTLREVKDKKEVLDNKKILTLLTEIANRPFIPFSSRLGNGLSKSKNDSFRVMKAACDENYIRKVYIKSTKGRGQPALYLEITKEGLSFLRENGKWKKQNYFRGKMSFAGSLILHTLIKPYYQNLGYETHIEGFLKGADCDLGVMGENKTLDIAVELCVTTDARHEAGNIRRNFSAGWENTIIIIAHFEDRNDGLHHSDQKSEKKRQLFTEFFSRNLSIEENRNVEIKTVKDYRREK